MKARSDTSPVARVAGRKGAARPGEPILFLGGHCPLREAAEFLHGGRGQLPVRQEGDRVPRPADVVLCGEFRLPQRAPERRAEGADRHPSPARLPVPPTRSASCSPPSSHRRIEQSLGVKGRIHFNVGGASAVEDAMKIVRNHTGRNHTFAFMGGYHGRTLGATAIAWSYRYREHYGHFCRPRQLHPLPLLLPLPPGQEAGNLRPRLPRAVREALRVRVLLRRQSQERQERVRGVLDRARPGDRGLHHPAVNVLQGVEKGPRPLRHPPGRGRDPDGLFSGRGNSWRSSISTWSRMSSFSARP